MPDLEKERLTKPFYYVVMWLILDITYGFHGDLYLLMFSFVVFTVTGVIWELQNWKTQQGFAYVEENTKG